MNWKEWILTSGAAITGWIANIVAGKIMGKLEDIEDKVNNLTINEGRNHERLKALERRVSNLEKQN